MIRLYVAQQLIVLSTISAALSVNYECNGNFLAKSFATDSADKKSIGVSLVSLHLLHLRVVVVVVAARQVSCATYSLVRRGSGAKLDTQRSGFSNSHNQLSALQTSDCK